MVFSVVDDMAMLPLILWRKGRGMDCIDVQISSKKSRATFFDPVCVRLCVRSSHHRDRLPAYADFQKRANGQTI